MLPFAKYLLTNSAVGRHATQSIKSVCFSPPSRPPKSRSTARVNDATGVCDWVYLSSGFRVRRPIMVIIKHKSSPYSARRVIRRRRMPSVIPSSTIQLGGELGALVNFISTEQPLEM